MSSVQHSVDIPLVELPYKRSQVGDVEPELPAKKGKRTEKIPSINFPWQARASFIFLFLVFVTIGASYFWIIDSESTASWVPAVMSGLWGIAGIGVLALVFWIWQEFTRFGNDLSTWAESLRMGELSDRMPIHNELSPSFKIRLRLNEITDDYQKLSQRLEQRYFRQELYIKQKKHYLNVLYDVASCINRSSDLEDLLNQFLITLKEVVNAEAATVRLLDNENQMRLVASIGLSDEVVEKERIMPAPDCLCGKAAITGNLKIRTDVRKCGERIGKHFFDDEQIELIAIPLQYRDKILGIYNLFVDKKHHPLIEDEYELLLSIGQHLGMAIEKSSLDGEARLLSIMEERTRMAHELHDSLAQTLASLRYKVRLFDDSLLSGKEELIWSELEGLEGSIDDANKELRSLITDFRAPIDGKGIVRAVERLAQRFEMETGLEVSFYQNWHLSQLPRETEIEVVRIVQEALANIRKHSQAKTIRILLYSSEDGQCRILVEDDGVGMEDSRINKPNEEGEHIGLTVMKERAERINAELQFESEEGEGTLIQLSFIAPPMKNKPDLFWRSWQD